jgi:hypothetical protein
MRDLGCQVRCGSITTTTDELSRERLVPRRIPSRDYAVFPEVSFRCQAL